MHTLRQCSAAGGTVPAPSRSAHAFFPFEIRLNKPTTTPNSPSLLSAFRIQHHPCQLLRSLNMASWSSWLLGRGSSSGNQRDKARETIVELRQHLIMLEKKEDHLKYVSPILLPKPQCTLWILVSFIRSNPASPFELLCLATDCRSYLRKRCASAQLFLPLIDSRNSS